MPGKERLQKCQELEETGSTKTWHSTPLPTCESSWKCQLLNLLPQATLVRTRPCRHPVVGQFLRTECWQSSSQCKVSNSKATAGTRGARREEASQDCASLLTLMGSQHRAHIVRTMQTGPWREKSFQTPESIFFSLLIISSRSSPQVMSCLRSKNRSLLRVCHVFCLADRVSLLCSGLLPS